MKTKVFDYIMKFLIVLTIILGIIGLVKPEWIKAFLSFIEQIIAGLGAWNYVIVFLSSFIEAFPVLGVVVPGQNILFIVGGFFGKISSSNLIYVGIIASIGAIIGNYIGYFLGKIYGEDFFKEYGLWFGIGTTEVKYLKKGVNTWGPIGIILGKFHPITRAFLPFIAGSMGMKNTTFFIYNIIGSVVRSVVMVLIGVVFAQYYEIIIDNIRLIFFGVLLLGVGYIYFFKKKEFLKYLDDKNDEIDEKLKRDYERKAQKFAK